MDNINYISLNVMTLGLYKEAMLVVKTSFWLKFAHCSVVYVPILFSLGASIYPESVKNFFTLLFNNPTRIPTSNWHIAAACALLLLLLVHGIIIIHYQLVDQNNNLCNENQIIKNDIESLSSIFMQCGGVYLEEIWLIFLNILYKSNDFSRGERISLYCYSNGQNGQNGHFIMLARHSDNPDLKAKGRGVYRSNEGCIWLGWTHGKSCINGLPDYKDNKKEYIKKMSSEGHINKKTIESLHMKPRSIGSFAINDLSNKGIAVVVIESSTPDKINPDLIATISSSEEINNIRQILTRFGDNLPKMNTLKEKGF